GETILINGEILKEVLEDLKKKQNQNALTSQEQTIISELESYHNALITGQGQLGKISNDTISYLKKEGIEISIPVGSTTYVPFGYLHTIRNGSLNTSSWDFTFKGCNLIMYKFPTPTGKGQGQFGLKSPDYILKIGNITIYIHKQRHSISRPLYNNVEMYFTHTSIKINGKILNIRIPKEDPAEELYTLFISIPKGPSITLPCRPLKDNIQLIRLMPWPTNINSNWDFKNDRGKIKANVNVWDEAGQQFTSVILCGGENIFLNNSEDLSDKKVKQYEIENISEGNFEIAIVTIVSAKEIKDIKETVILKAGQEVEVYGKDFNTLSRYFGGDSEKLIEQLKTWQQEYKETLNKEVSLLELTTFKDDQHPNGTEYFLVTDKNGNYLKDKNGNYRIRPRDLCHKDGTWHRSVFVLLVDKEGRILIQVRSDSKKFFPGCRDTSASGHLGLVEEYLEGAIKEAEEEVFDSQIKLGPSRIIRVGNDAMLTVIHRIPNEDLNDQERSSLYIYFVTDEEKAKIKKQESEVKALEWVSLQDEISRHKKWKESPDEAKKEGIDYAALGIDILAYEDVLQQIQIIISEYLLKSLSDSLQGINSSQIILAMDKDKTLTEANEKISEEMLQKIVNLLSMGVQVVIITGGILEHSLSTLIEPVENALKNRGMADKLVNFHYYYMSGSGWVYYDEEGNRQSGTSSEEINPQDQKEIMRAMAISFLEEAGELFKLDVRNEINMLNFAETIADIEAIFSKTIEKHSASLGYITINNRERVITLELKTALDKEANKSLQNVEFIRKVNEKVTRSLREKKLSNPNLVNMYGATFIDYKLIDKKEALQKFISYSDIKEPVVITIGDFATDYGFLSASLTKGKIISYLVGIPGAEGLKLPETVNAFPIIGPEGTNKILEKLESILTSNIGNENHFNNYPQTVPKDAQSKSENQFGKKRTSVGFTLEYKKTDIKIQGLTKESSQILKQIQIINQLLKALTKTGPPEVLNRFNEILPQITFYLSNDTTKLGKDQRTDLPYIASCNI
ncbi:MAG: NUDIX domain-containing protein, partial [Candidatus Omnitrophica bacterium]|nr:NUDIX domain-containing protein [Candidatus Omnitrophota bacterium]